MAATIYNSVYTFKVETNNVKPIAKLSWLPPAEQVSWLPSEPSQYIPNFPHSYNIYYKEGLPQTDEMPSHARRYVNIGDEAKFKGYKPLSLNILGDQLQYPPFTTDFTKTFETPELKPGVYTFAIACVVELEDFDTGNMILAEYPLSFKSGLIADTTAAALAYTLNPNGMCMTDNGDIYYISMEENQFAELRKITPYGGQTIILDQTQLGTKFVNEGLNDECTLETDGKHVYMVVNDSTNTDYFKKILRINNVGETVSVKTYSTSGLYVARAGTPIRVINNKIYAIEQFTNNVKVADLYLYGEPVDVLTWVETGELDDPSLIGWYINRDDKFKEVRAYISIYAQYKHNTGHQSSVVETDGTFHAIINENDTILGWSIIRKKPNEQSFQRRFTFPEGKTSFGQLRGITTDNNGNIFVSEYDTNSIWRVDTSGNVTLYSGSSTVPEESFDFEINIPDLSDYIGWIGDVQIVIPPGFTGELELRNPEGEVIARIPLPPGLPVGAVLTFRKIGNRFYIIYNGRIIVTYLLNPIQMAYFNSTGYTGFYRKSTNEQVGWENVGEGAYLGVPPVDGGIYSLANTYSEPMDSNIILYSMGLNYYGMTLMIFEDDTALLTRDPLTEDIQRAVKIIYGGRNYGLDYPYINFDEALIIYYSGYGDILKVVL